MRIIFFFVKIDTMYICVYIIVCVQSAWKIYMKKYVENIE